MPNDRIELHLGDARQSIRALPSDAFDIVIDDAFGGLAVPWHLTTTEFLDEVARVLRPVGAYVPNIIDYPPLRFVRAEAATLATVFTQVAVTADRRVTDGQTGGNLVLVTSDTPLDRAGVEAAISTWGEGEATAILAAPDEVTTSIGPSVALMDDFAPVDQLLGR